MEAANTLISETGWVDIAGVLLLFTGIGLIITEIFLPALGLFGILGIACTITGTVVLHNSGFMERWDIGVGVIIGLVSTLVMLSLAAGWIAWRAYKERISTGPESLLGAQAHVVEWNGTQGRVRIQGEIWQAVSDGPLYLQPGAAVLVARVEDLHLKITTLQT